MPRGYDPISTLSGGQETYLNQLLGMAGPQMQQAQAGFESFLPGGQGNNPIIAQANRNFQQQTLPQILQSFGSDVGFGSSSLNQALASGASDLNTNIASILAQNQLAASQGLGNLALGGGQLGLGTRPFDYMQKQPSFLKQLLLSILGGAGEIGKGWATGGFKF